MKLTAPEFGVLLLVSFSVFYYLGKFAVFTALAGLLGTVLVGTQGLLGHLLADVAGWANRLVGDVLSNVLGFAVSGILAYVLGVIYIHDLHPKNPTGNRTAWIGIALGALIAGSVTGIPALAGLHSEINRAAASVLSLHL